METVRFSRTVKKLTSNRYGCDLLMYQKEYFPDGTPVDSWFYETYIPSLDELGEKYVITRFGIADDGKIHTEKFQNLIEEVAQNGGGTIVVPRGTFLTGALFFRQGVNLYIEEGGTLKGSSNICDYPVCPTRIEGESCLYFPALINADGIDGFKLLGSGTIDGNGLNSWKAFWLRRKWNPQCTNKDEQRPRLVYISNCSNVLIANLHLQNSHFWTNHIYKSHHVKFLNCNIFSPAGPVPSPSTDAIDIDVSTDILVKNCYMEVNDDSVVLKGGKGPWADTDPDNGSNERILVEDCKYGFCHSCLTCGSESIHNRNVIVRRIEVNNASIMLCLKMRPDTPQNYEYITMEDVKGRISDFININPWTQFYDLKGREDIPLSYASNITLKNCQCDCKKFFNVTKNDSQYRLSNFTIDHVQINAKENGYSPDLIQNASLTNATINIV